jgi:hypothetical protein
MAATAMRLVRDVIIKIQFVNSPCFIVVNRGS